MSSILRAGIAVGVIFIAGCSDGEALKTLSSVEIDKLLKGNTIEGVLVAQSRPFKQYFSADGTTVRMTESKRIGKWNVDDTNQLCVRWNVANTPEKMTKETGTHSADNAVDMTKTKKGKCFQIKQDSQGKYSIYSENLVFSGSLHKIVPGNSVNP